MREKALRISMGTPFAAVHAGQAEPFQPVARQAGKIAVPVPRPSGSEIRGRSDISVRSMVPGGEAGRPHFLPHFVGLATDRRADPR